MSARPKTSLSRERIVAAALELLDRDGLESLSMRALGRELGVDPMAVYHYLPNKEALLDAIVEAVWSQLRLPSPKERWQDEVLDLAGAVRDVLRAHPNALPMLATRQNLSAAGFDVADHAIAVLGRAGLAPADALDMLSASFSLLIGHALAEVGPPPLGADDATTDLAQVLDARYPNLLAAIEAKDDLTDMDVVWQAGVSALIAGIARAAPRRTRRP